eukprot:sb/3477994/
MGQANALTAPTTVTFHHGWTSHDTPEGLEINSTRGDLGVMISDDLSWEKQVGKMAEEARKMSGWALRAFKTHDRKTMHILCKTIRTRILLCTLGITENLRHPST